MADEKIVTKKTVAKKAAPRKTAAKKASVSQSETTTTESPASQPAAKRRASPVETTQKTTAAKKKSSTTSASSKTAPRKRTVRRSEPGPTPEDNRLRLLASATSDERLAMINEAAYYKAEKRNFVPGHEQADWADAEREIDELIARAKAMTGV